ncbi:MAG: hypothetical protein LBH32_11310 [Dysgonamonadaceae bacterium]|jgi:hypothetical protein|nr:hypothetical protein [Dysgonamonadaceae bacterium]
MKKDLIASLILCFLWTFNLMAQDMTRMFNITFEIEEDTDPQQLWQRHWIQCR